MKRNTRTELFLGLISGTSADAVDAALVAFSPAPRVIAARAFPLSRTHRGRLLNEDGRLHPQELLQLDASLGEAFADAALSLLEEAGVRPRDITAIGSHGQTLWHAAQAPQPSTLQLGDPNRIAEATGIATVADFRRRDMAAGGEGAPLAPAFHAAVFTGPEENRGVLNLGGIANLTILPAAGRQGVQGFDTGPASTLMDAWCRRHRGQTFDAGGGWAASGRVEPALLEALRGEAYFRRPPPKSTGPETFNLAWLEARGGAVDTLAPADVQATLLELTASTVAEAVTGAPVPIARLLVCGGGIHNTALMQRLRALLTDVAVESTADHGIDPDYVEAAAFAWLARQTLAGRPGNLPSVTGARGERVLGAVYPAGRVPTEGG